jgi:hypothetical protein
VAAPELRMANEAAALRNAASLLAHRSVELWQLSVYSSPFLAAKTAGTQCEHNSHGRVFKAQASW